MSLRLSQNFVGRQASVISEMTYDVLATALSRVGVKYTQVRLKGLSLNDHICSLQPDRDLVIVDADSETAGDFSRSYQDTLAPIPVVGLISGESPSRLKILMRLGATAMLRKPIHAATIYPALFLAINEHRRRRLLEIQAADQERRRGGRRYVIKAVLYIMANRGLDDEASYDVLRRDAMSARLPLEEYCRILTKDAGDFRASSVVGELPWTDSNFKPDLTEKNDDLA